MALVTSLWHKGARETACFEVSKFRWFVCSAAILDFAGASALVVAGLGPALSYRSPLKSRLPRRRNPKWRPKGQKHETSKQAVSRAPLIQLYAIEFRIFSSFSPHSPAFTKNCSNALNYACDVVCGSKRKLASAIRV